MPTKNVLVIDTNDCLSSALQDVALRSGADFDAEPIVARTATSFATAIRQLGDYAIDIAVVTEHTPDFDRIIRTIHSQDDRVPIIVIRKEDSTTPGSTLSGLGATEVLPSSALCDEPYQLLASIQVALMRREMGAQANSELMNHLDEQVQQIVGPLVRIENEQKSIGERMTTLEQKVGEVSTGLQDHYTWHVENQSLTEMLRGPWTWAVRNKQIVVPLAFLLSAVIWIAARLDFFSSLAKK